MIKPFCKLLLLFVLIISATIVANAQKILIKTSEGEIKIELYAKKAPITVANFLKYVDEKIYDGASFYRTVRLDNQPNSPVKIEVIQGGTNDDKTKKSFPPIELETTAKTKIKHLDGTISMARSEPNSATSEFFICINAQPELDFGGKRNPDGKGFAAFGKVIKGMDVVRKIQAKETKIWEGNKQPQLLAEPVKIISIRRI
ncbi:MAG: peptidylprolyl isomerase [Pyrinomonadaceae bacterium]|nr:peptidylprolyl isomerase [Pyrinomonadaceae bacterium]